MEAFYQSCCICVCILLIDKIFLETSSLFIDKHYPFLIPQSIGKEKENSMKNEEISGWKYTQKLDILLRSQMSFLIRRESVFWSRKASVITEIYQVSMCLCVLSSRDLFIFCWVFPFLIYLLCYQYFGTFLSTWSLSNSYFHNYHNTI